MPAGVQNRQAPALVILGQDGKGEMVNYRVKDQLYVVDRLFDRAQLILGPARRPRKWRLAVSENSTAKQSNPLRDSICTRKRRLKHGSASARAR